MQCDGQPLWNQACRMLLMMVVRWMVLLVMRLRGAQKFCKEAQGAGFRMRRALP